jgi:N-acetylmuramic acid 6-phosphate etherase
MSLLNLAGARNRYSTNLDIMEVDEIVQLIYEEEKIVPSRIEREIPRIIKATDVILSAIKNGGRLVLCGAGSVSARLVESEVAQLEPSYGFDPTKIIALSFGLSGPLDVIEELENKEEYGEEKLRGINLNKKDVVLGVSASGGTLSIVGCFKYAEKVGALKIALCCNNESKLEKMSDISIVTVVGPEIIVESTRHKGGTAHKIVLDMITTSIVVKLGYMYSNLKVGLPTNKPNLREKGIKFIVEATECSKDAANKILDLCEGDVKIAIYMILNNINSLELAKSKLNDNNGHVRLK